MQKNSCFLPLVHNKASISLLHSSTTKLVLCFFALCIVYLSFSRESFAVPLPAPLPKQDTEQGFIENIIEPDTPTQYLPKIPEEEIQLRYPNQTITLNIGATRNTQETLPFVILQEVAASLYQTASIQVAYVPGRAGGYAVNALLQQAANAHYLSAVSMPAFAWQTLLPNKLYQEEEIAPLLFFAKAPVALWVEQDAPWQNLQELVTHLHSQSSGSTFFSGLGRYSSHHLAHMVFQRVAGLQVGYLPFQGDEQGLKAVQSGTALAIWGLALTPETMPGMRPLAIAADERSSVLPETTTFKQAGYNLVHEQYFGLGILASTQEKQGAKAANFFQNAIKRPEFATQLTNLGFQLISIQQASMATFMAEQKEFLQKFLEEFNVEP